MEPGCVDSEYFVAQDLFLRGVGVEQVSWRRAWLPLGDCDMDVDCPFRGGGVLGDRRCFEFPVAKLICRDVLQPHKRLLEETMVAKFSLIQGHSRTAPKGLTLQRTQLQSMKLVLERSVHVDDASVVPVLEREVTRSELQDEICPSSVLSMVEIRGVLQVRRGRTLQAILRENLHDYRTQRSPSFIREAVERPEAGFTWRNSGRCVLLENLLSSKSVLLENPVSGIVDQSFRQIRVMSSDDLLEALKSFWQTHAATRMDVDSVRAQIALREATDAECFEAEAFQADPILRPEMFVIASRRPGCSRKFPVHRWIMGRGKRSKIARAALPPVSGLLSLGMIVRPCVRSLLSFECPRPPVSRLWSVWGSYSSIKGEFMEKMLQAFPLAERLEVLRWLGGYRKLFPTLETLGKRLSAVTDSHERCGLELGAAVLENKRHLTEQEIFEFERPKESIEFQAVDRTLIFPLSRKRSREPYLFENDCIDKLDTKRQASETVKLDISLDEFLALDEGKNAEIQATGGACISQVSDAPIDRNLSSEHEFPAIGHQARKSPKRTTDSGTLEISALSKELSTFLLQRKTLVLAEESSQIFPSTALLVDETVKAYNSRPCLWLNCRSPYTFSDRELEEAYRFHQRFLPLKKVTMLSNIDVSAQIIMSHMVFSSSRRDLAALVEHEFSCVIFQSGCLGGLDWLRGDGSLATFRELVRKAVTVVYVLHDQKGTAEELAAFLSLLEGSRSVEFYTNLCVFKAPKTTHYTRPVTGAGGRAIKRLEREAIFLMDQLKQHLPLQLEGCPLGLSSVTAADLELAVSRVKSLLERSPKMHYLLRGDFRKLLTLHVLRSIYDYVSVDGLATGLDFIGRAMEHYRDQIEDISVHLSSSDSNTGAGADESDRDVVHKAMKFAAENTPKSGDGKRIMIITETIAGCCRIEQLLHGLRDGQEPLYLVQNAKSFQNDFEFEGCSAVIEISPEWSGCSAFAPRSFLQLLTSLGKVLHVIISPEQQHAEGSKPCFFKLAGDRHYGQISELMSSVRMEKLSGEEVDEEDRKDLVVRYEQLAGMDSDDIFMFLVDKALENDSAPSNSRPLTLRVRGYQNEDTSTMELIESAITSHPLLSRNLCIRKTLL
ncbi:hypothetical protein NDN08_007137 [Rhodosorus marinus]|uniref:Uncharacterized protein n=1 Tax=Rhodosorus marinus TaxID=101924 RepID=A0AAV8UIC9_9RHOD|nr:hypothetical protein NDN08_007137 [Rhodosorus marinus]